MLEGCWADKSYVYFFMGVMLFLPIFYEVKPKVMNRRLIPVLFSKTHIYFLINFNVKSGFTNRTIFVLKQTHMILGLC